MCRTFRKKRWYAQICCTNTVADTRDGACSSSTLKEASSWGKVDTSKEQMVFAEATSVLPLIASDAYHRNLWKERQRKSFSNIFG